MRHRLAGSRMVDNMVRFSITAILLALFIIVISCDTLPSDPSQDPSRDPAGKIRAVNLADWSPGGYETAVSMETIDRIAATGANTVSLVITAYQNGPESGQVRSDRRLTPTMRAVTRAIERIHGNGMSAAFKPHIDLYDGSWRGLIKPGDPTAWFRSYEEFLLEWARLAETLDVRYFMVGTELAGTIEHDEMWRSLIEKVRNAFSGELMYAASWDEASRVPFWDALDYAGVDFYLPVTSRNDPARSEILSSWQQWLEQLGLLQNRTGIPLLLTEIGYRSVDGAGIHPYSFLDDAPLDTGEQADLYWAALEATGPSEALEGIFWWNWLASGEGGNRNRDYTPVGKEAEQVLIRAWGGISKRVARQGFPVE